MKFHLLVLCLFAASAFVKADNPYPQNVEKIAPWANGLVGNGTIYYQTKDYYFFGNVQNPITVSIEYHSGYNFPASFCLNTYAQSLPIAGTNLESNCPAGGYGVVSNTANVPSDDTPDGTVDDTTTAEVFVKPARDVGFIVTLPDAVDLQNFTMSFKAKQCDDLSLFPVGSNGQCISIPDLKTKQVFSVGAGTWQYFRVNLPAYSKVSNNVSISSNGTSNGIMMFLQEGYIPTQEWFLNSDNDVDGDVTTATILTPGHYSSGQTYFLGIFNSNDGTSQVSVNMTVNTCSPNTFGYNCQHKTSNTTSVGGIRAYSGILTSSKQNTQTINNGTALSYDYSDDQYDHDYAYFVVNQYPNIAFPYSIRVSVGNNDISDLAGAPPLFAKLGTYPSAQSNDYNISTYGDVVHQLNLPITSEIFNNGTPTPQNSWYVAVQLPNDFSIWVGTNCANNCSNGEHGDCMCDGVFCTTATNNGSNTLPFYHRPTNLSDSSGACVCDKDKYDFSYDCTQKNNGNSALYILLIAIGGLVVLGIAIGVPIYCYVSNKNAKDIDDL